MSEEIFDLRTALSFLKSQGEEVVNYDIKLSPEYEVANHYVKNSAGVPASSTSREEDMLLYTNVEGADIPVLMGVFGSRKRNQLLLTGQRGNHHSAMLQAMFKRVKPVKITEPVCQEIVINQDIDLLKQLPVLKLTPQDAGPYITLGLVLAKDPETGVSNASIHRLCIQDKNKMTISIYPGRHLGILYQKALSQGKSLPISINIGLDPAVYFASCFTEPLCTKDDSELDIVGGIRQKAVRLSDCISVDAECLSDAEIILEGEITAEKCAENLHSDFNGSMPEFLGYQGFVNPQEEIPLVEVTAITHRKNPIYQAVIGPGLEQSELQSITPEVAARGFMQQHFKLDVKDIVFNTAGGGLLMMVLQLNKNSSEDDQQAIQAGKQLLSIIPPLKHLFIVDADVDPHSAEDLLWALTTRYQADMDMHTMPSEKPFPMDPTQTPGYRKNGAEENKSVKALFDCTVPWEMKEQFTRPFVRS